MSDSLRHLLTSVHGLVFGGAFLVGFPLALVALAGTRGIAEPAPPDREQKFLAYGLWIMAVLGWAAAMLGEYAIYPWYRAKPPSGLGDFTQYPRSLLLASPHTAWLHDFGMEWKEHVSWLAPITLTMVAYVYTKYGASLRQHRGLRLTVLAFTVVSFGAAGVAGVFGWALDSFAPVGAAPTHLADDGAP